MSRRRRSRRQNSPIRRGEPEKRTQPAREIGEEEEDGAGGDLLRDDLRGVPLLAVDGQGPRLDCSPPGREGELITGPICSPSPSEFKSIPRYYACAALGFPYRLSLLDLGRICLRLAVARTT